MARCENCKKESSGQKTAVRYYESGKLKTSEFDYCTDECKQNIHSFVKSYNKFAPVYFKIILVWLVLYAMPFILQAITGNSVYVAIGLPLVIAAMGVLLMFAPQGLVRIKYYRRVGLKYFNLFIRIAGLLMIASAISLL